MHRSLTRRSTLAAVAALALAAFAGPASAQAYPAKPITFLVPFAAGSATDQLARALGQSITEQTKQAVVVDNKAGASGMFDLLAQCPPLQILYRRRYARELVAEALSSAQVAEPPDPRREVDPAELECLAFQYWASRNLDARLLSDYSSMCLIGLGPLAAQEIVEHGELVCAAGDRRRHELTHLSCRDLIDVPLSFSREVRLSVRESLHPDDTPSWEHVERSECPEGALVTLGNALQTMLHHFSSGSMDYPLTDPSPSQPVAANDDLLPIRRPERTALATKTPRRARGGTVRHASGGTAT